MAALTASCSEPPLRGHSSSCCARHHTVDLPSNHALFSIRSAFALQVGFKRELIKEVKLFVGDAQAFRQDWEANGPMAPGLDPMDAVDRLKKFQQMFEVSSCDPSGPARCCREVPCTEIEHEASTLCLVTISWLLLRRSNLL